MLGAGCVAWFWAGKPPSKRTAEVPAVYVNGAPREKVTGHGKAQRWAKVPVTVKIDSSVEALGPGALAAVQSGFGAWIASDASLPDLSFDTTSGLTPKLEPDGVNAIIVAPIEFKGHKQDLALTISFVDDKTGRIRESDIIINSKKALAVVAGGDEAGCQDSYDLQSVLAHEAGHFFGLGEDHDEVATTMFYKTGKCDLGKRDLELPDRTVMTQLYEPAPEADADEDVGGGCGGATIARRGPGRQGNAGRDWDAVGRGGGARAASAPAVGGGGRLAAGGGAHGCARLESSSAHPKRTATGRSTESKGSACTVCPALAVSATR